MMYFNIHLFCDWQVVKFMLLLLYGTKIQDLEGSVAYAYFWKVLLPGIMYYWNSDFFRSNLMTILRLVGMVARARKKTIDFTNEYKGLNYTLRKAWI